MAWYILAAAAPIGLGFSPLAVEALWDKCTSRSASIEGSKKLHLKYEVHSWHMTWVQPHIPFRNCSYISEQLTLAFIEDLLFLNFRRWLIIMELRIYIIWFAEEEMVLTISNSNHKRKAKEHLWNSHQEECNPSPPEKITRKKKARSNQDVDESSKMVSFI